MVTILLVQPDFDEPTHIQATFFKKILNNIITLAKAKGIRVIVLYGEDANEDNLVKVLARYNPKFIYFGGHGDAVRIYGQNMQTLIMYLVNHLLLKGRLVYCFECSVAEVLGRQARAFIGYSGKFVVPEVPQYMQYFYMVGFYPLKLILENEPFYKVYQKTKALYRRIIKSVRVPDIVKKYLISDEHKLKLLGDRYARLIESNNSLIPVY